MDAQIIIHSMAMAASGLFSILLWLQWLKSIDRTSSKALLPVGFSLLSLSYFGSIALNSLTDLTNNQELYLNIAIFTVALSAYVHLFIWVKPDQLFKEKLAPKAQLQVYKDDIALLLADIGNLNSKDPSYLKKKLDYSKKADNIAYEAILLAWEEKGLKKEAGKLINAQLKVFEEYIKK